jgi:hypothetical protein
LDEHRKKYQYYYLCCFLLTPWGEQNIIAFPQGKAKHYWFLLCQLAKQECFLL